MKPIGFLKQEEIKMGTQTIVQTKIFEACYWCSEPGANCGAGCCDCEFTGLRGGLESAKRLDEYLEEQDAEYIKAKASKQMNERK